MKKKLKIGLWILLGLVVIVIVMTSWAAMDPIKYRNLIVNEVKLDNLSDGIYEGSFNGGRFSNAVMVTVKDHKILDIKKTKPLSAPTDDLYKQVYDEVMKKQSVHIDTISGASITTKTALKAIENALSK
jgi:uncharacterized protein with FMN-binding domain